jgi:argininosuccinate lyase
VSLEDVPQDELAAAHPALSEVPEVLLTPHGSVQDKVSAGSTCPGSVDKQLRQAKAFLATMEGPSEDQNGPGFRRE